MSALLLNLLALAQAIPPAAEPLPARGAFELMVSSGQIVTLRANRAPLSEIGKGLARELRTPVDVAPSIADERVSLAVRSQPLSALLPRIAPGAWMDIETDAQGVEKTRRILLRPQGVEPAPPPQLSQVLAIEGDTEDESVTSESLADARNSAAAAELAEPASSDGTGLVVAVDGRTLSVRARDVPALILLSELAVRFGVNLNASGLGELPRLNLDVAGVAFESLPAVLALPTVVVVSRRNLLTGSVQPLEIGGRPPLWKP